VAVLPPPRRPAGNTGLPLWPLPLVAGLLPCIASLLALAISVQQGLVPGCNPFVDGCVSISRAARHGLPNHLFRALVLPAAALQALTWLLVWHWLREQLRLAAMPPRGVGALLPLGLLAGAALALYGSFLGTEGAAYRLLRQYGTVVYFGFTAINQLLAGGAVHRLAGAGVLRLPRWLEYALVAASVALALLGIGNAVVAPFVGDDLKDRVENVTEWWGALLFVAAFVSIALTWRRIRLQMALIRS